MYYSPLNSLKNDTESGVFLWIPELYIVTGGFVNYTVFELNGSLETSSFGLSIVFFVVVVVVRFTHLELAF